MIFPPIEDALKSLFKGFAEGRESVSASKADNVAQQVIDLINGIDKFPEMNQQLSKLLENETDFADLYPYVFDLLMLSFIAGSNEKVDPEYFESKEWEEIEESTSSLGSEILNLYIYMAEAYQHGIELDFEDYLHEFLIAEDELYQDDFPIYEDLLDNEDLIHEDIESLVAHAQSMEEDDELKQVLVPMIAFFQNDEPVLSRRKEIASFPYQKAIHLALFDSLTSFHNRLIQGE